METPSLMILKSHHKKNDRTFEAKRSKTAILHITRYLFIILFYIIIIYLFIIYIIYLYLYICLMLVFIVKRRREREQINK
jgi:preprotein translocase subunit SecG